MNSFDYYNLTTGSSTAYVVTNAAVGGFAGGQEFYVKIHITNTGSATFKLNNFPPKLIKNNAHNTLSPGDLIEGQLVVLKYSANDYLYIDRLDSILPAATPSLSAGDMIWAVTTTSRSSNAFSGDLAVAPPSLATGLIVAWRVPSAPSGASTYNLNSLGAKNIYRGNAAAAAADLPANRDIVMRYDGTQWQIIGFGTLVAADVLAALAGAAISLGTSSGSANALAGSSTVDIATTFTSGRLYRIRTNAANSGAATCSINGGTGVALRKSPTSTALASGDIADATELLLFYDGTYLQVLAGLTVTATDSTKLPLTGGTLSGALNFSSTSTPTMGLGRDGLGNLSLISTWALTVNTPGGTRFVYQVEVSSPAVAVANTTFTTVRALPFSPCRVAVFVEGLGSAELFWDGTTLSVWKSLADANILAAASASSGEVVWRVSSGNLQASNNTGSSKNCYAGMARR